MQPAIEARCPAVVPSRDGPQIEQYSFQAARDYTQAWEGLRAELCCALKQGKMEVEVSLLGSPDLPRLMWDLWCFFHQNPHGTLVQVTLLTWDEEVRKAVQKMATTH